ncbi:hypothetical protein CFP56_035700 [Quercus suber]|uniref:Wall-associated receptor kinase galacturonan-binding domain-containing protein n=1 Tax=Quercus suber TaxID=58331 RepID=A0AAW0J8U9_QUESU
MARGLTFTAVGLTVLVALTCCATAMINHTCSASCGNIHNISFPFRLETDPENCGSPFYELSCENNRTVLYDFGGKYYVQEISYNNYAIRIVDSGIQKNNYFSTPNYSLYRHNFSFFWYKYTTYQLKGTVPERYPKLSRSLVWMSCEKPVNSPLYLDTSTCNYNDNSSSISDSKRYRYVTVGITNASQVEDSCQVEKMFLTSWPINNDDPNISCTDVHHELAYGFELSWLETNCGSYCPISSECYLNDTNHLQCNDTVYMSSPPVSFHLETKIVLGIPCVVAFLIYKWRKRHLSMYDAIEEFLQSQINLMPISGKCQ